ncbi:hypothetical protein sos41_17520 [Alphaproteobacteria bacterium SO-S41]|nr:hypothetical protein sos41_17520 [Alphaproteobacteria bacterium SO-S41]
MQDLFGRQENLEPIPMVDAEVSYLASLALPHDPIYLLDELVSTTPWRHESVSVWGKTYAQPRLIAWFGDVGKTYKYSSISLEPLPWSTLLREIQASVENIATAKFNSVLLNYYRDQNDSMGFHSDDERELGFRPTIASVSFGAVRTLVFKHKKNKAIKTVRLDLASGSLLIMRGETQENWQHGIAKSSKPVGPRVNLTFRQILSQ